MAAGESEKKALPKNFSLSYKSSTAGVLPRVTSFLEINRIADDKDGGFLLIAGVKTNDTTTTHMKKKLTEADCLNLYNAARKIGFFGLNDQYVEDEFGGMGAEVKITAGDMTKTVSVYACKVPEFDKLVQEIDTVSGKIFKVLTAYP